MKFSLNNIRLRGKMLILYFMCVFIPIVMTDLVFYKVTTNHVKSQKMQDISLSIEQIRNNTLSQISAVGGISYVIYTDSLLNDTLEKNYSSAMEYVEAYNQYIRDSIYKYSPVYKALRGIRIYTDNSTIVSGGVILPITNQIKEKAWYRRIMQKQDSTPLVMMTEISTLTGPEKVISIIRRMDYFSSDNSKRKILKIDMDMSMISDVFNNLTLQGNVYLVNNQNHILYTTDPTVDWGNGSVLFDQVKEPVDVMKIQKNFRDVSFMKGWKLIGMVSEREVLRDVRRSRNFVIYLAIPNIVIPTLIILLITRSLNVRIIRLLKSMKRVKNRRFELMQHERYEDEIGQLSEEFNRMTIQIKRLIDEVYISEIQKKDLEIKRNRTQLNALQSQINPHFLFNALETIRMRSLMKNEKETAKIIQNMAKIFRNSLSWDKDWVPVRDELNLIACFLEIQKYRFGNKLEYVIDVDEAAYNCLVPNMGILPFVENASIHGIEPLKGAGRIEIAISLRHHRLAFRIRDNGVGIHRDKLQEIFSSLEKDELTGDHIGIKNVYYRLKLYYNDGFHFEINSKPQQGTEVCIVLPAGDDTVRVD